MNVFVPGIMEHVERTGVHSGDSISVYPPYNLSDKVKATILDYTRRLGLAIGIVGLYNIQFIVDKNDDVYIIEVNPRSSRTVPFLSKATGWSLADIGTLVMLGVSLPEQGITELCPAGQGQVLVRQGPGLLLLEALRPRRLPLSRDEVHRRGHRLATRR